MLRALGQVGDALLAADTDWRVSRPDPADAARALRTLARDEPELAIVVVTGSIVTTSDGEPALLADRRWDESAASTAGTVPLATLRQPRAAHLVIVVAGWPADAEEPAARWLEIVASRRDADLVAVAADGDALAAIQALHQGLAGAATDPATGTVTLKSLGAYLLARVPRLAIAAARDAATICGTSDPRSRSRLATQTAAPEDLTGTTLPGQFRLDARLAGGGFGTVYRAKQLAVGRDVAVKVLHGDVGGRLFVQETQSVGRIDHPNVVRIYHADVTPAGRPFLAMELLDGRDLEQVIEAEGRLPPERAIAVLLQLLRGLGAAHAAGVVHADLKPANVVLVGDRVVLVDFGLSRLEAGSLSVGGTPAYMAPEQLRDERIDARSDLFAAALVLVTLLTGWRRRAKDELVPPLDVIEPTALRTVLARALAIDPATRFASAEELAAALVIAPRRRRWPLAVAALALAGIATAIVATRREEPSHPAVASSTTIAPYFADRPTIVAGGSGTLMWGFFAPLASFLETTGELIIPITSQNDVGSGGALAAMREHKFDIALLSRRAAPDTLADERGSGKVLVEVVIGFDETALFVRRDNPVRAIDVAAIRAHLCCADGETLRPLAWADLGATGPGPVAWVAYGRIPIRTREVTSATLALADEWLCAPDKLCASDIDGIIQANDVLPTLVTSADVLALSSRSFATDMIAQVAITDRAHGTRLDGRKAFWVYALVDANVPMPAALCKLFGVVLDPAVAGRLAAIGKASGLPDPLRLRQRAALGLDDNRCATQPPQADADHRLLSPIADDVEVKNRWVRDAARSR